MSTYYQDDTVTLLLGDTIEQMRTLPDGSVNCIVTSPPYYGLRNYGTVGQYGLEESPAAYVQTMRAVFTEARRVLTDDGTLWLNLGDSYGTNRQLLMIPARVALTLQQDGWVLRNEVVWHKPNGMPSSARDRLTNKHEKLFLLTPNSRYHFDLDAIREPHTMKPQRRGASADYKAPGGKGRNDGVHVKRSEKGTDGHPLGRNPGDVWSITTRPYPAAHFAVFPIELPARCIKAGCKSGGTVLDPFSGSGTTGAAARQLDRRYIGIDLSSAYHDLARERFVQGTLALDFGEAS